MELFPDRAHVRLRSREHGTYLHADEDSWGVSLSPRRASLNTAWAVHLLTTPTDDTYFLLRSAAYGRYLAFWILPGPQGRQPVFGPVQHAYHTLVQSDVLWTARRHAGGHGNDEVDLDHAQSGRLVGSPWIVEAIPPRLLPPDLPPGPVPNGTEHEDSELRFIRYIQADHSGIFILPWRTLQVDDRHLVTLIDTLATVLDTDANNVRLCVKAGFYGRLTPLVIDLPISNEPMDIIVFTTDPPAHLELRHPDVDAP